MGRGRRSPSGLLAWISVCFSYSGPLCLAALQKKCIPVCLHLHSQLFALAFSTAVGLGGDLIEARHHRGAVDIRNASSVKAESLDVCSQNLRFNLVSVFGVRDEGGQFTFDVFLTPPRCLNCIAVSHSSTTKPLYLYNCKLQPQIKKG
jgi:hypothetical protein